MKINVENSEWETNQQGVTVQADEGHSLQSSSHIHTFYYGRTRLVTSPRGHL